MVKKKTEKLKNRKTEKPKNRNKPKKNRKKTEKNWKKERERQKERTITFSMCVEDGLKLVVRGCNEQCYVCSRGHCREARTEAQRGLNGLTQRCDLRVNLRRQMHYRMRHQIDLTKQESMRTQQQWVKKKLRAQTEWKKNCKQSKRRIPSCERMRVLAWSKSSLMVCSAVSTSALNCSWKVSSLTSKTRERSSEVN
jgi:hypothetical protein